jgi:hypothetical protein
MSLNYHKKASLLSGTYFKMASTTTVDKVNAVNFDGQIEHQEFLFLTLSIILNQAVHPVTTSLIIVYKHRQTNKYR